jgi:hypothetical protein
MPPFTEVVRKAGRPSHRPSLIQAVLYIGRPSQSRPSQRPSLIQAVLYIGRPSYRPSFTNVVPHTSRPLHSPSLVQVVLYIGRPSYRQSLTKTVPLTGSPSHRLFLTQVFPHTGLPSHRKFLTQAGPQQDRPSHRLSHVGSSSHTPSLNKPSLTQVIPHTRRSSSPHFPHTDRTSFWPSHIQVPRTGGYSHGYVPQFDTHRDCRKELSFT